MESPLGAKAQRLLAMAAAANAPRGKGKFDLVAKLPMLLASVPYDDQLAYLCYITRQGNLEAARIAKEHGILTKANVGGVLVRLIRHLMDNRDGYADLLVEGGIEGPEYCDMPPKDQERFVALVEWLIRDFDFTPEAARKVVDTYSVEAKTPLPLLAAQTWLPLDADGSIQLLTAAMDSLGDDSFRGVHFDKDSLRAVEEWPLFHAYARKLLDGYLQDKPRKCCFREVIWGAEPAAEFQNISFVEEGVKQGSIMPENNKCGIGKVKAHVEAFRAFASLNEERLRLLGRIAGSCLARAGRPALVKSLREQTCYAGQSNAVLALAEAFVLVEKRL